MMNHPEFRYGNRMTGKDKVATSEKTKNLQMEREKSDDAQAAAGGENLREGVLIRSTFF